MKNHRLSLLKLSVLVVLPVTISLKDVNMSNSASRNIGLYHQKKSVLPFFHSQQMMKKCIVKVKVKSFVMPEIVIDLKDIFN